ncbi:MAG: hypothetical protein ABSE95_08040 [Thermodesulfobacteriota bacterium]|jgi:hypothetical protein
MEEDNYELTPAQAEWASKRRHGLSPSRLGELIKKQKGQCALSGAEMIFEKEYGNPNVNTRGCHPLYAAIDHISPNDDSYGHQIVCYDLNDLKGHLPYKVFKELQIIVAWRKLMDEWRSLAEKDRMNIEAFKKILRD